MIISLNFVQAIRKCILKCFGIDYDKKILGCVKVEHVKLGFFHVKFCFHSYSLDGISAMNSIFFPNFDNFKRSEKNSKSCQNFHEVINFSRFWKFSLTYSKVCLDQNFSRAAASSGSQKLALTLQISPKCS